mmetsp:Transcript_5280/g.10833  ORF Transcript_5280/g.10833 Transcript_5280/m.10833 type:complete len:256 (+) Transcript_5280:3167-3934(+)
MPTRHSPVIHAKKPSRHREQFPVIKFCLHICNVVFLFGHGTTDRERRAGRSPIPQLNHAIVTAGRKDGVTQRNHGIDGNWLMDATFSTAPLYVAPLPIEENHSTIGTNGGQCIVRDKAHCTHRIALMRRDTPPPSPNPVPNFHLSSHQSHRQYIVHIVMHYHVHHDMLHSNLFHLMTSAYRRSPRRQPRPTTTPTPSSETISDPTPITEEFVVRLIDSRRSEKCRSDFLTCVEDDAHRTNKLQFGHSSGESGTHG